MPEELENEKQELPEAKSSVPNSLNNIVNRGPMGPNLPKIGGIPKMPGAGLQQNNGFNPQNAALKKGATEVAKKIPGVGLLAHTPMGKKMISDAVDGVSQAVNGQNQEASEETSEGAQPKNKGLGGLLPTTPKLKAAGGTADLILKVKKYGPIVLGICGVLSSLIGLVIIISIVMKMLNPLFVINGTLEKLGSIFEGCGFTTKEECLDKRQTEFYDELKTVYNQYLTKYNVKLDKSLLVASLTYVDIGAELGSDDFTIEDIDSEMNPGDYRKLKVLIRTLADKMAPLKTEEIKNEKGEIEIIKRRKLDLEGYKIYLEKEFVPNFYLKDYFKNDRNAKAKIITNEIYSRIEMYNYLVNNKTESGTIYAYCKGVTVVDSNKNVIGTYDLETYVAGVISGEAYGGYPEAANAQAIAARTYVLHSTNNCENVIGNTDSSQVFNEDIKEFARTAAEETAGQVLTYNGDIFSAQYDSFCFDDARCPDSKYDQATDSYIVEYTRLPDETKHTISIRASFSSYFTGQGHARGMSQLKSYEMDEDGYTYDQILKYFYSDGVEISSMNSMGADGTYGHIEVIDGIFYIPSNIQAGVAGTKGEAPGGYNGAFYARLQAFVTAAEKEGITIVVPIDNAGAYRSYDEQDYYYQCYLTKKCNNGNSASPPGKGQHGWGLASDLNFSSNAGGRQQAVNWAHANAAEFGLAFNVSSEDWHIEPAKFVYR